nr:hypothetical protein [Desulfobacula sp.]
MTPLPEPFIQKFRHHLEKALETIGITLSSLQMDRMAGHAAELLTWNQKMNLTAIKDPFGMAEKHFFDSIAVASFLENETSLADIGSGGGFPGIPLKIMKPELNILLIDASQKKSIFSSMSSAV